MKSVGRNEPGWTVLSTAASVRESVGVDVWFALGEVVVAVEEEEEEEDETVVLALFSFLVPIPIPNPNPNAIAKTSNPMRARASGRKYHAFRNRGAVAVVEVGEVGSSSSTIDFLREVAAIPDPSTVVAASAAAVVVAINCSDALRPVPAFVSKSLSFSVIIFVPSSFVLVRLGDLVPSILGDVLVVAVPGRGEVG